MSRRVVLNWKQVAKGSWFPGKEPQGSGTLAGRKSTDVKDITGVEGGGSLIFMESQDEAKNCLCLLWNFLRYKEDIRSVVSPFKQEFQKGLPYTSFIAKQRSSFCVSRTLKACRPTESNRVGGRKKLTVNQSQQTCIEHLLCATLCIRSDEQTDMVPPSWSIFLQVEACWCRFVDMLKHNHL